MTRPVRYDDSLGVMADALVHVLGSEAPPRCVIVREAYGRLALLYREILNSDQKERLSEVLGERLGGYLSELRPVLDSETPGASTLLSNNRLRDISVTLSSGVQATFGYIDRRIIGADWLAAPAADARRSGVPRVVFSSLKGGVGRSTALAVLAAHAANEGYDVLVIDLDLEAPGVGTTLLTPDRMPRYGALDYFVENGINGIDDTFLNDMVATSDLSQGRGLVHVVPGTSGVDSANPQNVLGKLARAYLEDPRPEEGHASFLGQVQELIDALLQRHTYDLCLVDARAGLNESTAAALLGLGADVLLFGRDNPQTRDGYDFLLSHLGSLPVANDLDDWRLRLKMVFSRAPRSEEAKKRFVDGFYKPFSKSIYDRFWDQEDAEPDDWLYFNVTDEEAPHWPLVIYEDTNYASFDPRERADSLSASLYGPSFSEFLSAMMQRLGLKDEVSE